MKKRLHIISDRYPYGSGEQFFENEIIELSKKFDSIVLYPLSHKGDDEMRVIPGNVRVNSNLANMDFKFSKTDFLRYFRLILSILCLELLKSNRKRYILKKFKKLATSVIRAIKLGETFKSGITNNFDNYYYSFWMNSGALSLAILKKKKQINDFQFRVNGFDIFETRYAGGYMPFRFFNLKMVKQVFVLSNPAVAHLKNIRYYPEKLKLAHYGVYDQGKNPFVEKPIFQVVSCSGLVKIKRVDKIIESLKLLNLDINWTHFGDGPLRNELELQAKDLPKNITYEFKGNRPNSEIINLYKTQPVSLFIHMSETEGLGMAIVEAQSFGIPAVVLGVGGVIDIVNQQSGLALDEHATIKEISEAIQLALTSKINSLSFRDQVKAETFLKFNAKQNYNKLYIDLTN